jgi:D-psicose/D-tagatose/L-ribulose 3-epimerase
MALEPLNRFETYFLNRADQAVALAEGRRAELRRLPRRVPHEHRGGRHARRDPQLGKRLADVHVAENNRLAPGMGRIDWREARRARCARSATTAR